MADSNEDDGGDGEENNDAFCCWSYHYHGISYAFGGALYMVGSIFFLPMLVTKYIDVGAWCFVCGSIPYSVIPLCDCIKILLSLLSTTNGVNRKDLRIGNHQLIELLQNVVSFIGGLGFLIGSTFFLSQIARFELGGLLFAVGCIMVVLQSIGDLLYSSRGQEEGGPKKKSLLFFVATSIFLLIGALLFTIASIPYILGFPSVAELHVSNFLVSLYIIGSLFFILAGVTRQVYDIYENDFKKSRTTTVDR